MMSDDDDKMADKDDSMMSDKDDKMMADKDGMMDGDSMMMEAITLMEDGDPRLIHSRVAETRWDPLRSAPTAPSTTIRPFAALTSWRTATSSMSVTSCCCPLRLRPKR